MMDTKSLPSLTPMKDAAVRAIGLSIVFIVINLLCSSSDGRYLKSSSARKDSIHSVIETLTVDQPEGIRTNAVEKLEEAKNSATGAVFLGEPFRNYMGARIFEAGWQHGFHENPTKPVKSACSKWAVVTTIFAPSEGVKRAAALPGWCMVIVADTSTPEDYMDQAAFGEDESSVHFLSVDEQHHWAKQAGVTGDFIQAIPYRHFARKNIGYLYAIQHGASMVFDFDDDNILHLDAQSKVLSPLHNETHLENVRVALTGKNTFNHHPLMGASVSGSWARGFPIESVQDEATQGSVAFTEEAVEIDRIGVIQLCADMNPDVDAVHRLIKPLPMTFTPENKPGASPIVVPSHAFAPYNAQATIHTYQALWGTFLPVTVPGRVSDIWRGYFAEALFRDLDLSLAFAPPRISQDRNEHSYLGDMKAELDLYFKAGKLLEFLSGWRSSAETVPERMEALWIDLYERGYIEETDVKLVQLWLGALVEVGYRFPTPVRHRHNEVVLMGQFNYATEVKNVIFWVQKWREVFDNIQVRGPFNETQLSQLRANGIYVYRGRSDKGFYSPIENLARTLQDYKDQHGVIRGVLYLHDDAFLNMTELTKGRPFPKSAIIGSSCDQFPHSYIDPRVVVDRTELSEHSFAIKSNGVFSRADGQEVPDWDHLGLREWPHWRKTMGSLKRVWRDPRTDKYKTDDGTLVVPPPAQSDFLYVPTAFADEFAQAAEPILGARVFLELALPTIVHFLQRTTNVSVETIELCSEFNPKRGEAAMVLNCALKSEKSYGLYHPFKISKGLKTWGSLFDTVTMMPRRAE